MRTTAIFAMILSVFITGCKNNEEQTSETTPPIEHKEAVHPEQVGWEDDIELDQGRQWEVNRETTEGVQRISQILEDDTSSSVEEYRELGNRLEEEKNNLNSGRTNNGASDENLDIYLGPLDQKIQQLQEVESEEEGARIKSDLEQHLYAYSNYFV